MGCNCGGSRTSGRPSKWVYTAPDGTKTTFDSEVLANAARIRAGGGGKVEPA